MALTPVSFTLVPRTDNSQLISDPGGSETPPELAAVTNFRVTNNTSNSQTLEWDYSLQLHTGFEIQRKWDTADWTTVATPTQNARSWTSSGLPANTLILHRIRAVDENS